MSNDSLLKIAKNHFAINIEFFDTVVLGDKSWLLNHSNLI
jgi:hypothetical protein